MNDDLTVCGMGCGLLIVFFSIIYFPIVFWTDRNLDFYCSLIKGEDVDVPLWVSFVASLFEPIVLLDLIGEILRHTVF